MKNHNPCGNSLSDLMEVLQERNETIDQLRSEIKRLSMSSSTCLLNDFTRDSIFLCSISNNITGSPKMLYESDKIYAYLDTPLIDDKVLRAPKRKNTQHATQTNGNLKYSNLIIKI